MALEGVATLLFAAHTAVQLMLAHAARRGASRTVPAADELPLVTIQLPVFNEKYVVAALLRSVAALQYPRDRLQVQVLDDSTDETVALVAAGMAVLTGAGIDAQHVQRSGRDGFKAGALAHGLTQARGELVAVFDADFTPLPDFLLRAVPHFEDPAVAVVQGRWSHLNRGQSLVTEIQALMLDVHFGVEQAGRAALGCFLNFNGTAGIWRVAAIEDAGGWSPDTLTEDLDLSYRAQLRGWQFVYDATLCTPAELPGDLRSYRVQQFRWMKGVTENAIRLLAAVVRARLRPVVKLHAVAHLLETSLYPALAVATAGSVPLALMTDVLWWLAPNPLLLGLFLLLAPVYYRPYAARGLRTPTIGFVARFLAFSVLTAGMSFHNARAVLAGLAGRKSPFVRTPKAGTGPDGVARRQLRGYLPASSSRVPIADIVAWLLLLAALCAATAAHRLQLMPLPTISFIGLTWILASLAADAERGTAAPTSAKDRRPVSKRWSRARRP